MTREKTPGANPAISLFVFLLIFLPITAFFEYAVVNWSYGGWITGMMWSVGISAVITMVLLRRPIAELGFGWGKPKYLFAGLFIPIAYGVISIAISIVLGLVKYDTTMASKIISNQYGLNFITASLAPLALFFAHGVSSMGGAVASGLGEEIGWRGFLAPELRKIMPFFAVSLISGMIWGAWHFPILFGGNYGPAGAPSWLEASKLMAATTFIAFPMTYLRLRSGSVWPAAILHGSHNLFLNNVIARLADGENGKTYVGETGLVTLAVGAVFAIITILLAKRRNL